VLRCCNVVDFHWLEVWPRPPRRSTKEVTGFRQHHAEYLRRFRASKATQRNREVGIDLGMSCNSPWNPQPATQRSVKWHEAVALLGLRADKLPTVYYIAHLQLCMMQKHCLVVSRAQRRLRHGSICAMSISASRTNRFELTLRLLTIKHPLEGRAVFNDIAARSSHSR
jgi:hypothetical protein